DDDDNEDDDDGDDDDTTTGFVCPTSATVGCGLSTEPSVLGTPTVNNGYTVTGYSDEYVQMGCPQVIIRHWLVTDSTGMVYTCDQQITVTDTEAPVITIAASGLIDCNTQNTSLWTVQDCDADPTITVSADSVWTSSIPCDGGALRTQTQGGWGAVPNGNNPGVYLHANFDQAFPNGLILGCNNQLVLTSAQAITAFLPSGSTPSALPSGTMTNPGNAYNNVLAGQLVAAMLNVGFDAYDPSFGESSSALGSMVFASGDFQGMTIAQVISLANEVIGGCSSAYSYSQLNQALTTINENYDNGNMDQGDFLCPETSGCVLTITYNITATDDCGNSSSASVIVYLIDDEAPVFPVMPEHITVPCHQIPEPTIDFSGDCFESDITLIVDEQLYSGACYPTIQRTFTASDMCGNTTSFTQYITVVDTIAPIFTYVPSDITIACGENIPDTAPEVTDECEGVVVTLSESVQGSGCEQQIQRTWTATDYCGNTSFAQQLIYITDQEGPQITGQSEFVFACVVGQVETPMANDACGVVVSFDFSDITSGDGCNQITTRTWTAIDNCGNISSFVQHIEVSDSEAPVFTFVPSDMTVTCGETVPSSEAIAIDNCGSVQLSLTETQLENTGNCSSLIRTWTAIDECGNTSFASQFITFEDTIAPVLSQLPASYTGNCDEMTTAPIITANDNCDSNVEVVYGESLTVDGCSILVERTWLAVDDCGNVATHLQQITIVDDVPPSINAQAEITVACNELSSIVLDVTDICHTEISVSYSDAIIGTGCSYDIQRLWTATDPCGNTSTFNQLIHIVDSDAPVFSYIPPSMTGVCVMPTFVEQPVVSDLCSGVIQPVLTQTVTGSGCNMTIVRTWTATDACGNTAIATQTISVQDNIIPVITGVPQDITVDCGDYTYPAIPGGIQVSDNCDGVPVLEFHEVIIPGSCPAEFSLVRTWTATDACGNTSTDGYTIYVVDVTPPVFTNTPTDVTVSCGALPPASAIQAVDDCGGQVTIILSEQTITGGCPHVMRTWTATDACGNSSTFTQQITIQDEEPPVFQAMPSPGPTTCNNIPPVPDPIVTDNCDDNVQVSFSETMIGTGCEFTLIRMWIAEDDCGNSAVISQSIIITDTAPPVFVQAPGEITVSCSALNGIAPPNVVDDCSGTVMTTFTDVVVGSGCQYIINRTYTATDLCGNAATATQIIHVVDETAPVMSGVPFGTFVNCANIPPVANVTANDNCSGSIPVQFSQQTIGSGCNYQIVRTWTATDNCGNTTVRTQYIYVNDNTAPVLTGVPAHLVLACDDMIPPAAQPTATDACAASNLPVLFIEFSESTNCGSIITRMWSASDACGNTVTASQTITITDDVAPVLLNTPAADVFVSCDNIPAAANVLAMDQCSGVITEFDEVYQFGVCPFMIERTWTAIDACGNTSSFVQHIHVSDEVAPTLSEVQAVIYLGCGERIPETIVTANDNCSSQLDVTLTEDTTWSGCTQQVHRVWSATDLCGNTATRVQDIFITDNDAPVFLTTVSDMVVSCQEVPQILTPEIEDCNMGQFQVLESVESTDCISEYTIIRRYIATDACGHSNEMVQAIVVEDNEAPVLSDYPADMDVNCSDIPSIPVVEIATECDATAQIEFSEDITYLSENNVCHLETTQATFGPLAMWLPGIAGVSMFYVFDENGGTFTKDELNGTAHITGHVINTMNPEQGWDLDLKLYSQRNWTQWSALGRSYKDDYGLAGEYYVDWTYYELDPTSTLTGTGLLSGSVLTLTHAPADYYYGFQLGLAANNRNAEYGISGWFDYSGNVNGVFESGHGDVNAETNCCPEQTITRTWRVIDCAGNATVHTQVIHVVHDPVVPMAAIQTNESVRLNVVSGSRDYFTVEFTIATDSKVTIDLYDITGNMVDAVFSGEAQQGRTYRITYPKAEMDNGLYYFMLSDGKNVVSKSAMMMN
ncbi:MAG: hypothetical protein K1X54_12935, partial [Flavobacteriales bacterium]|nr:hypothetical protein [Flavobacteriales bacterium]